MPTPISKYCVVVSLAKVAASKVYRFKEVTLEVLEFFFPSKCNSHCPILLKQMGYNSSQRGMFLAFGFQGGSHEVSILPSAFTDGKAGIQNGKWLA